MTSPTVTVTDPGWTGQFTNAETLVGDQALLGATSAQFTWDQPLQYAWIDVVDETGEVLGTCSTVGSLECSAGRALGPDESLLVHAEARVSGPSGGYVTIATSSSVELTGMDADAYALFILTAPESALAPLLGTARAAQAATIRAGQGSLSFCHALGTRYPSNAIFHSTAPDATLMCMSGAVTVLAWLIATVGIDAALDGMSDAADTDADLGAPGDPGVGGGGFDDPDCYFYNFSGQCIDVGAENPALGPQVQNAAMPTYWGGTSLLCRAIHVDSTTGERTTYELRADGLEHIVRDHVARPASDKSVWDLARFGLPAEPEVLEAFEDLTDPQEFADLVDFLCQQLATAQADAWGLSEQETGKEVRIYQAPDGLVGLEGTTRQPTHYFTVVITPEGDVWSAYPGTSPILQ